jgi:hypothetical protein
MSLFEFQDRVYLHYKQYWFVWEPAWESFRPIDGVRWNGTTFVIDDITYCKDPLDEFYGYGTAQMKQVCSLLRPRYDEIPKRVYSLDTGNSEWFRDRFVAITPCAPRDKDSWKRMVQGKHRTCRRAPRGKKLTRRNL